MDHEQDWEHVRDRLLERYDSASSTKHGTCIQIGSNPALVVSWRGGDFALVKVCMGPPDTFEEVIIVPQRSETYHRLFVAHGFPSEQAVCLKAIPDILETVESLSGLLFNLEMIKVSSGERQLTPELIGT